MREIEGLVIDKQYQRLMQQTNTSSYLKEVTLFNAQKKKSATTLSIYILEPQQQQSRIKYCQYSVSTSICY